MAKNQCDILYVNFYTDGSAAKKLAPAFPESRPKRKTAVHKKKKPVVYLDPVAVFGIVTSAVLVIMMIVGLAALQSAQAQVEMMEGYVDTLTQENHQLAQQYEESIDLAEVEKTALALGLVPIEQAQTVPIRLEARETPEQSNFFQQILFFLTNLFA